MPKCDDVLDLWRADVGSGLSPIGEDRDGPDPSPISPCPHAVEQAYSRRVQTDGGGGGDASDEEAGRVKAHAARQHVVEQNAAQLPHMVHT